VIVCHLIDDKLTQNTFLYEGCVTNHATLRRIASSVRALACAGLWLNGAWSQRDNFLPVPTDCPQRNERFRWMVDGARASSHRGAELQPALRVKMARAEAPRYAKYRIDYTGETPVPRLPDLTSGMDVSPM
jgi:hypothetical protein